MFSETLEHQGWCERSPQGCVLLACFRRRPRGTPRGTRMKKK